VSWWRGEGNALDSAGVNHGTLMGSATTAPGISGNGFSFNGSGFVVIPDNPSLSFASALTIGLWYESALNNNVYYGLIDKRVGAVGANYGINHAPGYGIGPYYDDLSVYAGGDEFSSFETSRYSPAPGPGQFHHLAVTYSQIASYTIRLETYIDGKLVRTRDLPGNLANTVNSTPVTIGATAQGAGEYFSGIIDEVVIYNRVLSLGEIMELATVPEPTTASMVLLGLVGIITKRLHRPS